MYNTVEPSGVEYLLQLNSIMSSEFITPDASNERCLYSTQHSTPICVTKCMDSRVNFSLLTMIPSGVLQPWRNLGGRFDYGWPHFQELIRKWYEHTSRKGSLKPLMVHTYHFSESKKELGCRGWNNNSEASKEHCFKLREQCETLFGSSSVCVVSIGIETDTNALIVHSADKTVLDMRTLPDPHSVLTSLTRMFPHFPSKVITDFAHLLAGNSEHISRIKLSLRTPEETDHKEWALMVGGAFDWLHIPDLALIVGPFDQSLETPIRTTASLILENIVSKRVDPNKNGIVMMSASPVYDIGNGIDLRGARMQAEFLASLTMGIVMRDFPALAEYMYPLVGTVDMETRIFHRQDYDPSPSSLL